ncbi:MAG: hypothetical protein BWY08_00276 [Bacteroidetes bacterium ADurb.Bin174]|nr:MAG: hypothetical protein BWY08_00276 [Bacteroidetes bacterium ADurb.Bin174]
MEFKISTLGDYSHLFSICREGLSDDKKISIDITGLNFINPHDVLIIVEIAIWLHKKHSDVEIIIKSRSNLLDYLTDIGLFEFVKTNHEQSKTIKAISSQTAMPIRRIDVNHIDEYIISTLNFIRNFCYNADLTMLSIGIQEAINNVHDHSESIIGAYVFCQYYPKINEIKVCVTDMGVGIPKRVREFNPKLTDAECIEWAVAENNTTKTSPQNSGKGLTNISDFVFANGSRLNIYSNNGCYSIINEKEYTSNNPIQNFFGTLIEFTIKVDNLHQDEELDISNF